LTSGKTAERDRKTQLGSPILRFLEGLDEEGRRAAEATIDLDAEENACPACGQTFERVPPSCPGCGLRLAT